MFFGEGRKAFLEYLRNLTPQVLFLTLAIVLSTELDLRTMQIDLQGFKNALPFVMCLAIFLGSVMANTTLFIDSTIVASEALKQEAATIKESNEKASKKTLLLLSAAWKHKKQSLVPIALTFLISEACLVGIFLLAIQGALSSPFLQK